MKKIINFIFVFIAVFCFTAKIDAETTSCTYSNSASEAEVTFQIKNGDAKRGTITIKNTGNDENVRNWDKDFESSSFKGENYYNNNNQCPPYAIVARSNTGFNLFVSDGANKDKLVSDIKKYFSTLNKGYPIVLSTKGSEEAKQEQEEAEKEQEETYTASCMALTDEQSCETDKYFSCIWNETKYGNYCNTNELLYIQCGNTFDIPHRVPELVSFAVNLLKIATPIILILVSIISLMKALASSKEDEIKKAQNSLIKKIIAAVMVFFVISIVQFVILKVADSADKDDFSKCMSCFLNNKCGESTYYKTNVGGIWLCKRVEGDTAVFTCPEYIDYSNVATK